MLKRVVTIIKKDMLTSARDAMLIYIIIAPILLALLLNTFIPSANSSSIQIGTLKTDDELAAFLQSYSKIEQFAAKSELEERILKTDDLVGIYKEGGSYKLLLEGNEPVGISEVVENILMQYEDIETEIPVNFTVTSLGFNTSLVAIIGAISLIMMCMVLGGMITGFNIVEEKQYRTMRAINVSPVKANEFIIAKAIPGLVIPLLQSIAVIIIIRFTDISWAMIIIMIICSSLISLIIGFFVGVLNDDPITAIASLKLIMLPLSATVIGALLLSEKLQVLLYWIPFYWQFKGLYGIIDGTATMSSTLLYCSIIVVETVIVYMFVRKRIERAL